MQPPKPPPATDTAQPKEVTFSVRLTTEEHELLKRAAIVRGWTPTNLIRTATLGRAAHILNTSRVTTFNFKGLAARLADQLFKPRTIQVDAEGWRDAPEDWIPTATAEGLRNLAVMKQYVLMKYWERRSAWEEKDKRRHASHRFWVFRNKLVEVEGWETASREETVTRVKHKVLSEEKAFMKTWRQQYRAEHSATLRVLQSNEGRGDLNGNGNDGPARAMNRSNRSASTSERCSNPFSKSHRFSGCPWRRNSPPPPPER